MASSQPRDYRRMLYRLDRATKYESIPALVQHMMEETVLDGILELRMVTSSSTPGQSSQPTQLRLPSTFILFRREGRDVNAVALYSPRSSRTPPSTASGRASSPTPRSDPMGPTEFPLEVKKCYAPRTTLVWVFSPLVQRPLTEGASTVLFECRSYLAGSDVAREVRAADAAAAAESAAARAAALDRGAQYHHQQQVCQQQAQHNAYDPNMYQWQQDPYAAQQGYHPHPGVVAPVWNPHATYPVADATYLDGYGNPVNSSSEHYYSPPTAYDPASVSPPMYNPKRSPTPRSGSQGHSRTHRSTPSPSQAEKEEDPALEPLTRRTPFKRMLGYAGKQHDGSIAVYELPFANMLNAFFPPRPKPPRKPKLPPASKFMQRSEGKTTSPVPPFPLDIIERIADFLFEVRPPGDLDSSLVCSTKPPWADVDGFMSASPELHGMGYVRWMTVLTIRVPEDWDRLKPYCHRVRELCCPDGAFNNPRYCRVLVRFKHLYAVSIDAHSDISRNDQNQFAYRELVNAFPPSLRRLEITRAHGPDIHIIATAKECCPNLEELRLGRCTIFNSPSACDIWRSFPFNHNLYMSTQDINLYAHSLAQELLPLRSLKSLRLGLYLIPSTTVLAHRLYHRHNLPVPPTLEWQQEFLFEQLSALAADATEFPTSEQLISFLHEPDPATEFGPGGMCERCSEAVNEISRSAEASANGTLKELVPSLEKIQWMNWFTAGHLGLQSYTFPLSG